MPIFQKNIKLEFGEWRFDGSDDLALAVFIDNGKRRDRLVIHPKDTLELKLNYKTSWFTIGTAWIIDILVYHFTLKKVK